jgi:uncharacterized membrane protein
MTVVSCAMGRHRLNVAYVRFKLVQKEPASETDVYIPMLPKAAASQSSIGPSQELLC